MFLSSFQRTDFNFKIRAIFIEQEWEKFLQLRRVVCKIIKVFKIFFYKFPILF